MKPTAQPRQHESSKALQDFTYEQVKYSYCQQSSATNSLPELWDNGVFLEALDE